MFETKLSKVCGSHITIAEPYRNGRDQHKFGCSKGHIFSEQPSRLLVYADRGMEPCTKCREENRRLVLENAYKEKLKVSGFTCTKYINNKTPIKHKCKNNHVFLVEPARHNSGIVCPKCLTVHQEARLKTFEIGYKALGWSLVSYERVAGTAGVTVTVQCDHCDQEKTMGMKANVHLYRCKCLSTPQEKQNGQRYRKLDVPNTSPLPIRAKAFCKLVSQEFPNIKILGKYRGHTTPMDFMCNNGHTWSTKPSNLLACVVGCPDCGRELAASKVRKTNEEYIYECISATNGKLSPVEEYINDSTPIKHRCSCGKQTLKIKPNIVLAGSYQKCVHCRPKTGNGFSLKALNWMQRISDMLGVQIQHAGNSSEKHINLTGYTNGIKVDGFDAASNTVYEFLGDVWHGSPFDHIDRKENRHPYKTQTDGLSFYNTMKRIHDISKAGYNIVWVWESSFDLGDLISGKIFATKR